MRKIKVFETKQWSNKNISAICLCIRVPIFIRVYVYDKTARVFNECVLKP